MKKRLSERLSITVNHPYLNLFVGGILLYAGLSETLAELRELEEVGIGGHHGIMLYAVIQMLKAFAEIVDGLKWVDEASH